MCLRPRTSVEQREPLGNIVNIATRGACSARVSMRRACHREWHRTVRSLQGHSWNSWGNNGKRAVYSPKSAADTSGCNESSLALHTLSRLLRFAHHCAEQRLNLRFKRLEGGMRRPRLRTQHNIAVCGKLMLIAMRQYSESTFHRIANHRVPHRFGDGQTQTPRRCRTGRGRRRVHHVMQHNVRVTDPTAAFEYGDKFAMVFQPLHFACESGGEDLRPLARRRLMSARPARVRMRTRKPLFM